jgi:hypothetical protein
MPPVHGLGLWHEHGLRISLRLLLLLSGVVGELQAVQLDQLL